ncbi:uncharacterized protein HD556DRAFT_1306507 [Suillus plorans]|uniref:Uncharacterized protein n=1 Tax=Suillus plorans TaxID=116603 RepID=A0A9P7DKV8_9AGAM|nr:uncharacterized protein HD556DRAFT_1306507 [Suillus plorans]KAG1797339.1 hypothetical protein HD556DRAFT_1306507 [Suillus plorans]
MASVAAYNTIIFGDNTSGSPSPLPPVGALVVVLAASLVLGTSHTFASLDSWSFDSFITPGNHERLGTGDHILVYRQVFNSFVHPLPLPVFSAAIDSIAGWGRKQIEFRIRDLNTGNYYPNTIRLPLEIVHLSRWQQMQKFLYPFPRMTTPPSPPTRQSKKQDLQSRSGGIIGDRVPRDSDGLPIWD